MIEQNLIKPKSKIGLNFFLNAVSKWRNDLVLKKINHVKLLQIVLDESGYSAMLKNKKDLDNENRLENIKELLSAMKEFDNLESFLEHVSLLLQLIKNGKMKSQHDDNACFKRSRVRCVFTGMGRGIVSSSKIY